MTDWKAFRAQFPALEKQTWVNAAATSPLPLPVYEAARAHLDEVLESGDRRFGRWLEGMQQTRELLAGVLGGAAGEIAFTSSTSHSMNLVAALLRAEGIAEAVTLATEFPATTLPLLHHGVRLHFVEPDGGRYDPARIEAAIHAGVGALVVSHVQYALGCAVDLHELGAIARRKGVRFVVNATQSLGQRPVPAAAAGADFLVATGHKWLCAGFGAGMLWVRQERLEGARFPFAGWLSMRHPERMDNRTLAYEPTARVAEMGTPAFDAPLRLGAALRLLGGVGFEAIHARILSLTDELRAGLRRLGIQPLTPDDPAIRSGITSFRVADPERFAQGLSERNVWASVRSGAVRISLHAYNDGADVARVLDAVEQLAR